MKRVRIGNDINISLRVLTAGEARPLEGRNLRLVLRDPKGGESEVDFSVVGNTLVFVFLGCEQKHIGRYGVELWENEGMALQAVTDVSEAFVLVQRSDEQGGNDTVDLRTESIELSLELNNAQACLAALFASGKVDDSLDDDKLVIQRGNTVYTTTVAALQGMLKERINEVEQGLTNTQGTIDSAIKSSKSYTDKQVIQAVGDAKGYTDKQVSQAVGETKDYTDGKFEQHAGAINLLSEELDGKAPKVGYAPDLKVDFAKELVGRGVAEPQEIGTIRPTGEISIGDGNATIEKVKGNSVVWNQLYKKGCESLGVINNYKPFTENVINGVTFTAQSDGSIKANGTASGNAWLNLVTTNKSGHKFMMQGCPQGGSSDTYGIADGAVGRYFADVGGGVIYTAATIKSNLGLFVVNGTTVVDIVFKPQYTNLTQMFGAGNEPTTIEEFEARKPLGVTDNYNEGEIISYDAKELKSVGFNAFNGIYAKVIGGQKYHALGNITSIGFASEMGGETTAITLDSEGMFTSTEDGYVYAEGSDICIHLAHTYTPEHTIKYEEDTLQLPDVKAIKDKDGNQLFPYGLLSAGNAHDEITATKAIKRIGVVDLGGKVTTMIEQREGKFLYMASIPNIAQGVFAIKMQAIVNSTKYTVGAQQDWPTYMNIISSYNSSSNRVLVSSEIEGVASINEDLQGVLLYYELAEPIEVDIEEPLNLTYDAWDFGTEELIAEGATTPLNADVVYQFNAVDRIRENTAKNQALEVEIAELKAQLTQ